MPRIVNQKILTSDEISFGWRLYKCSNCGLIYKSHPRYKHSNDSTCVHCYKARTIYEQAAPMLKCIECGSSVRQTGQMFRCACTFGIVAKDGSGIIARISALPNEHISLETSEGKFTSPPYKRVINHA